VLANLALLVALLRIGDLIKMLSDSEFRKGIEKVTTHQFLFNPFTYFGPAFGARMHSSLGFGLLIVCWWVCYAAVSTLRSPVFLPPSIQMIFLVVGLASIVATNRIYSLIMSRMKTLEPDYAKELEVTRVERAIATFVSIDAGGLIYSTIHLFKS
jgi:hypothetical protein